MSPGAAAVDLITLLSRASSVTRSIGVASGAYLLVLTFFVVVVSAESVFIDQWCVCWQCVPCTDAVDAHTRCALFDAAVDAHTGRRAR